MGMDTDKGWNPYLAGSLAGLLLVLSTWVSGKFAGASTTYVRSIGMIEQLFSPERVKSMDYFVKEAPIIDWQWMFVIGIVMGSFISSVASGSFGWKALPDMWDIVLGQAVQKGGSSRFLEAPWLCLARVSQTADPAVMG